MTRFPTRGFVQNLQGVPGLTRIDARIGSFFSYPELLLGLLDLAYQSGGSALLLTSISVIVS